MVTSLSLSILATRNAGLASTVLEGVPNSVPVKTAPPPVQAPITVPLPKPDASNPGKPVPVTIPKQQAPAQPAPAKK